MTPSCASLAQGAFRALRRAAMGSAPGPRPLFCKKAGQKTFTGPDFRQPKPLAVAASDEISPRSGHLSGRVAPPTRVGEAGGSRNLTGAPPPHKRFSLGLHPVSLGKTKEMGWNRQHQRKVQQDKTASSTRGRVRPRPAGAKRGEPPARVPPVTPSCASWSTGEFHALRRVARAPPLDPARFFVKKRGKKLLNLRALSRRRGSPRCGTGWPPPDARAGCRGWPRDLLSCGPRGGCGRSFSP